MSAVRLKYLGLVPEESKALMDAVRATHPTGGMQTSSGCACGKSSGGGQGFTACSALGKIIEAANNAKNDRLPNRTPDVCGHESNGHTMIFEYGGDLVCEMCGDKV